MDSDQPSSSRFYNQLNQGDSYAFDQLFKSKHQHIYAYCLKIIHSPELAEEVMMDVFLTVWKKKKLIRADRSLDALLFKIAKDLSINCLKKIAREQKYSLTLATTEQHPARNATETQIFSREYEQLAQRAIAQLPPRCKLIYTMSYQQDVKNAIIAQELGLSLNTVKVQLAKARRLLKEYIIAHSDISLMWVIGLWFISR